MINGHFKNSYLSMKILPKCNPPVCLQGSHFDTISNHPYRKPNRNVKNMTFACVA